MNQSSLQKLIEHKKQGSVDGSTGDDRGSS